MKKLKNLKSLAFKPAAVTGNTVKPTNPFTVFPREQVEQSVASRFEAQVELQGDRAALVFEDRTYTYNCLNSAANRAANAILSNLPPDQRGKNHAAALLLGHDDRTIAGLLGTLKTGMFYVPLDPSLPEERLRYILEDCEARVLVTDAQHAAEARAIRDQVDPEILVVDIDAPGPAFSGENPGISIPPDALAYILYTSGSTGQPKGVMQSRRNVLHHARVYTNALHIRLDDRLTLFSSYTFDAAKMDIYGALLNGAVLYPYNIKKEDNLRRLPDWLRSRNMTIYHSIPTVYRYFTALPDIAEPFPRLRFIVLGGEAVYKKDIENYKTTFSDDCIFVNGLGPTESTLTVQYFMNKQTRLTREAAPVGFAVQDTRVFLLTENNTEPGDFGVGEIIFKSDHLALGYWKNPRQTQKVFTPDPLTGDGRVYRTGDLGRRLPDGAIEYAGRKDFQVKISGYRVETGEVESKLDQVEGIKKSVVVCRQDDNGENFLAAFYTAADTAAPPDETQLGNALKNSLPAYMVPSIFINLDNFPHTSTGKIDRKKLAEQDIQRELNREYVLPANDTEVRVAEVWKELLKVETVGMEDNFFVLGGNSLKGILLVSEIQKRFQVKISILELYNSPTVRQLATYIQGAAGGSVNYPTITPAPQDLHRPFPLTDIQMTYLLGRSDQFEIGGVSTHSYKEFTARLDIQRLNDALNTIIRRHPMLRAVVYETGEQQILEGDLQYTIEVRDLSGETPQRQDEVIAAERARMSHHIFDTGQWPLFEIKAFKLAPDGTYCLCAGEDRIITDNFSSRIIQSEILVFYLDPEADVPAPEISFRDYMEAYKNLEASSLYASDRDYWMKRLEDFPLAPSLPLRVDASEIAKPRFRRLAHTFTQLEWEQLQQVAGENNLTPSALLCGAYAEVLGYWSNQDRFALNLTLFNRFPFHKDVNKIVGDFTSVILLAVNFEGRAGFMEKAGGIQRELFEAIEHRHFDGVRFIREVGRHHGLVNKAVMPIVFTSLLFDRESAGGISEEDVQKLEETFGAPDEAAREGYFSSQTSQAFIDNVVSDVNGDLLVSWNFVDQLFDPRVIDTMFRQFVSRLTTLAAGETGREEDIFKLSTPDRRLLEAYNNTDIPIPSTTLHRLFAQTAAAHPDRAAAVHHGDILSYGELDRRSNRVARYLQQQGLGRGDFVGVKGDRHIATMINLMGITKSGAAYVPVDPEYPQERVDVILETAGARLLLDPEFPNRSEVESLPLEAVEPVNRPEDVAYVIFTSGSTGKPKGVVITHQAVCNTLLDINQRFEVTEKDRVMAISSLCFDLSVYDVFGTFAAGAVCVIIDDQRDLEHLVDTLGREHISLWNSVPSILDLAADRLPAYGTGTNDAATVKEAAVNIFKEQAEGTEETESPYTWSPLCSWRQEGEGIRIGKRFYPAPAPKIIPRLHTLAREGIPLELPATEFPGVEARQLYDLLHQLAKDRVLVNTILWPQEIFDPGNTIFKNKDHTAGHTEPARRFRREGTLSYDTLSRLLSLFKQRREEDYVHCYYASAGGLYPIDIYLHVKTGRVENLAGGLYYYNPGENTLHPIDGDAGALTAAYLTPDRALGQSSALSLYMVYNADVTMPKYGGFGYFMANLDAGIMTGTLEQELRQTGMESQPVGGVDAAVLRDLLGLVDTQVFIQSLELGFDLEAPEMEPTAAPTPSASAGKGAALPPELFEAQDRLFTNRYSKAITLVPAVYEAFKKHQLYRSYPAANRPPVPLAPDAPVSPLLSGRRSYRTFDTSRAIPLERVTRLLSVFTSSGVGGVSDAGGVGAHGRADFYYGGGSGAYGIDVYLQVKPGRVENLEPGIYRYHPTGGALDPVAAEAFPETLHFPGNRSIFNGSALSLFLVYNGAGVDAANAGLGYFSAAGHVGRAVAHMTHRAEQTGVGLCSIGNLDTRLLGRTLELGPHQVFLHALELGLKPVDWQAPGAEAAHYLMTSDTGSETASAAAPGPDPRNRDLRTVLLSGDWIPLTLPEKIKQRFSHARLYSLGGATEGSIWSIYFPVTEVKEEWKSIPYGYPLANQQFYVLNRNLRPCPVGVEGELYIGGVGVASGYMGDLEKTRNHFISHPRFGRIYKTGDHGMFRPGGYIEFLGRKDSQVKIRGYRVELGEIEACLANHPKVKQCLVMDRTGEARRKYLCAYLVMTETIPAPELRSFLAGKLPGYMIPSYFIYMDEIPLTPNGKINRKALPAPDAGRDSGVKHEEPRTDVEKTIVALCKEMFKKDRISVHENFFDMGASSIDILQLTKRLKNAYGLDIPALKMFEYSTISSFSYYLGRRLEDESGQSEDTPGNERQSGGQEKPGRDISPVSGDIAVIGLACRFPGAPDVETFWENLAGGVESISFFTEEELQAGGVEPDVYKHPGYVPAKGVLEGADCFDAGFFGYSPVEASVMDPQMRMFYQCCQHALEDAGVEPMGYKGLIGLYAGARSSFYWEAQSLVAGHGRALGEFAVSNLHDKDYLGQRLAYRLNLRGPCYTVQTACSTSLVSVHLACRDLRSGECDAALAGGVSIALSQPFGYRYQEGMIYSPDGHCRTFDAEANGTVFSDGAGVVVLKRYQDALRDGDHIYALVKGSAVNNDGMDKIGFTAPGLEGQTSVIRTALQRAGVEAESIGYIEAHGTATSLGDPMEIEALTRAFGTTKKEFCRIGSVKTNLGHLGAAAGIAGFIKTLLTLKHGQIPPSLHFTRPNPKIDFDATPFMVNRRLHHWQSNGAPRRAGVSSFGIGGTNAHAVLEEIPAAAAEETRQSRPYRLMLLSAQSPEALEQAGKNLAAHLEKHPDIDPADMAYTLQTGRRHFKHRRMSVFTGTNGALEQLTGTGTDAPAFKTGAPGEGQRPVVFMFPGQGAQYVNMGRELYETEPLFREEMDRCFDILENITGNTEIKDTLYPGNGADAGAPDTASRLSRTQITQPVLFVFEYALARLVMSWGIAPAAMMGHSIGEYVCACLSGVFSLEDALRLVTLRGRLMQGRPTGSMLSVPLPEAEVTPYLTGGLALAAINAPSLCVVSGPTAAIDELEQRLRARGHEPGRLHTSHAFHSAMMDPVLAEFEAAATKVPLEAPRITYISNVTGHRITAAETQDPGYWARHIRETVRFAGGVTELMHMEKAVFLEVGPGRNLSTFVKKSSPKAGNAAAAINAVNLAPHPRENVSDARYLTEKLGQLWLRGVDIDWTAYYADQKRKRVPLPGYPFQKQRFPMSGKLSGMDAFTGAASAERKKDMADWFYEPQWTRSSLPRTGTGKASAPPERSQWLIFADDFGLAEALARQLEKDNQGTVFVRPGTGFQRQEGDNPHFTIAPDSPDDYTLLIRELERLGRLPERIVHFWGVTGQEEEQRSGADSTLFSLIYPAQALGKITLPGSLCIDVITDGMQGVTGAELLRPEKAAILGAVRVIPKEYPGVRCRCIDIDPPDAAGATIDAVVPQLSAELWLDTPDTLVAYRGPHRWVPQFEPKPLAPAEGTPPLLKEGGVYLITGGLGGMGLVFARYLVETVRAKLILTGRTPLPPEEEWDRWLEQHRDNPEQAAMKEKIETLRQLQQPGGNIMTAGADLSNREGMREVLARGMERFGHIDGVIHAAGVPGGGIIQRQTPAELEQVLAPKVTGTQVLLGLLEELDAQPEFVVLCSSLNAISAPPGQSAYAGANAYLDAFAYARMQSTPPGRAPWVVSVAWDGWRDTGMAARFAKQHGQTDRRGISAEEGTELLARVLSYGWGMPQVVVSTRDLDWLIRQTTARPDESETKPSPGEEPPTPTTRERPDLGTGYTAPTGKLQETLAKIWGDHLGIHRVGIHDNFFDLGASSLDIIHVSKKIAPEVDKEVPVETLFEYPTIALLAAHLDDTPTETDNPKAEEAKLDRASERMSSTIKKFKRIKRT